MRWHRSGTAAIILAGLASSLTGCMPTRTSMRPETKISEDNFSPGVSKSGEGLAQAEGLAPAAASNPSSGIAGSAWPASPGEGALPKTDLGKSEGSATDTGSKDSNAMAPPVPGLFPLTNMRPKMMPLGNEQGIRRVSDEVPVPRVLPPKSEDVEEPTGKQNIAVPTPIPQPTISKPNEEPKKNAEAPKQPLPTQPVTPIQPEPRNFPIEGAAGTDLNLRKSPTVTGAMLNLGVNDSGVERAVELAKLLDASEAENRNLISRMKMLELVLENREKMLRDDEVELLKASQDLTQSRNDLQQLRDELTKVKKKLRQVEREDLENLRAIIQALEKLLDSPLPGS